MSSHDSESEDEYQDNIEDSDLDYDPEDDGEGDLVLTCPKCGELIPLDSNEEWDCPHCGWSSDDEEDSDWKDSVMTRSEYESRHSEDEYDDSDSYDYSEEGFVEDDDWVED